MISTSRRLVGFLGVFLLAGAVVGVASAEHAWGTYHWARTANPFPLLVGDNVSLGWDPYLRTAATDWSASEALDLSVVPGKSTRTCRPTSGRDEVCSSRYGYTGWLGIAQIWISGSHITQGVVKLNDTYFNTKTYNKPEWRALVMCQEIGHTLGLDHQDETHANANLGTCMDYTNSPSSNQHPNEHDYDMLAEIYMHLDTTTTVKSGSLSRGADIGNDPQDWGREVSRSRDGRVSLYERELGDGGKVFTHVFWTHEDDGRTQRLPRAGR